MKILGLDYGRKKIGLALGDTETKFTEPLSVIRFKSFEEAMEKVLSAFSKIPADEKGDRIVVGISEGVIARETKEFGKTLEAKLKIPVVFQDETLTTQEAQELSIKAGIKRKKRKMMEDAYSAALILQSYLDNL